MKIPERTILIQNVLPSNTFSIIILIKSETRDENINVQ